MKTVIVGASALLLTCLTAGTAEAQKAHYLVGGVTFELPARTETTQTTPGSTTIRGFNLGVGFPLGKASLEFAGVFHSAETDVDKDGRPVIGEYRIRNRDFPFVAGIRYQPYCMETWCAEVGGGFGVNFSRRRVSQIGACGTVTDVISPCLPVSGQAVEFNKEEPTGYIGAAVTAVILSRIEIGPSVRLWYVRRYRDALNDVNVRRTPDNARLEFGVNAVYYIRR